jgi:hypothetical protein
MIACTSAQTSRAPTVTLPPTSAPGQPSAAKVQEHRLYWKVFPQSDNTFYILPRPELTQELSTPAAMNHLKKEQAVQLAHRLNSQLQFKAVIMMEGATRMVRVSPEPLLEDIIDICKQKDVHPILATRCKKELDWQERGHRPDIYLLMNNCEAVVLADALNTLYHAPRSENHLCRELKNAVKNID